MESPRVDWQDVQDAAQDLFVVWYEGTELDWAKAAWEKLAAAGLTHYANSVDRVRVLLRFVALAMIYRDFCFVAHDESWDASTLILDAIEDLEVSSVRVGQLVGAEWEEDDYESSNDELQEAAIIAITRAERSVVGPALLQGFGEKIGLADALCRTVSSGFVDDENKPQVRGINDQEFTTAARIYAWIDQGMLVL